MAALAIAAMIGVAITMFFMVSRSGNAIYTFFERFPKGLAFLSGAIVGALFGLIPGATLGWMMGSRIVGAIVCGLCAAGAGYAWMRFETRVTNSGTKPR
jgi:hypothetical protein